MIEGWIVRDADGVAIFCTDRNELINISIDKQYANYYYDSDGILNPLKVKIDIEMVKE